MLFLGLIGFFIFAIICSKLLQYSNRIFDDKNTKVGAIANQKRVEDAAREIERIRIGAVLDLNKMWNQARTEYMDALQSGDKFVATAKGRDFYAFNRKFGANTFQGQVIADEIRIKNEVAKGGAKLVNALRLEDLDFEELRDRVAALAK